GGVDTNEVIAFVVDDCVKHDRSFAGLAVSDDEFALATSNRNHRIDGLKTGCHRLPDRLTINYAGSDALDGYVLFCRDRALVVDRLTQRVHHTANHYLDDWNRHDAAGTADLIPFLDFEVLAHQHRAYLVFLQVHGDSRDVMGELDQLAGHNFVQAMDARDTVADRDNGSHLVH